MIDKLSSADKQAIENLGKKEDDTYNLTSTKLFARIRVFCNQTIKARISTPDFRVYKRISESFMSFGIGREIRTSFICMINIMYAS